LQRKLEAVALLLFARGTFKLLVLEELKGKPEIAKIVGMFSFPLETMEFGETPYETLGRLLEEEIGRIQGIEILGHFAVLEFPPVPKKEILGYTVYCYLGTTAKPFEAHPGDTDILYKGWMTPSQLIRQPSIRREVRPILRAYFLQEKK
jgi:hypothetical protein